MAYGNPTCNPEIQTHHNNNEEEEEDNEDQVGNDMTCVTQLQFYAYHLHIREPWESLFCAQNLFQEFIVDMFAQVEQGRLVWDANNQSQL